MLTFCFQFDYILKPFLHTNSEKVEQSCPVLNLSCGNNQNFITYSGPKFRLCMNVGKKNVKEDKSGVAFSRLYCSCFFTVAFATLRVFFINVCNCVVKIHSRFETANILNRELFRPRLLQFLSTIIVLFAIRYQSEGKKSPLQILTKLIRSAGETKSCLCVY